MNSIIKQSCLLPLKNTYNKAPSSKCEFESPLIITYNLRSHDVTSERFYKDLLEFSVLVSDKILEKCEYVLHQYEYFVTNDLREQPRSIGEYSIEMLTIGITYRLYNDASRSSLRLLYPIFNLLLFTRNRILFLKNISDRIRGKLNTIFLVSKHHSSKHFPENFTKAEFIKLISWLHATGEFKDEVKRFRNWIKFFDTLTSEEIECCLRNACSIANWFEIQSKNVFEPYTANVLNFLQQKYPSYRGREDEIFCGKKPVEYHVNMVASEIMNGGLRNIFSKTTSKVVLVPGCMRIKPEERCNARINGLDIECTECDATCNVCKIVKIGKIEGYKTFIIPHTSGFTKWLKRWENVTDIGVVAIACPLNIVAGGYEMRELHIPSQCVMLDYCGCKKHWDNNGIPTDINHDQLLKLLKT